MTLLESSGVTAPPNTRSRSPTGTPGVVRRPTSARREHDLRNARNERRVRSSRRSAHPRRQPNDGLGLAIIAFHLDCGSPHLAAMMAPGRQHETTLTVTRRSPSRKPSARSWYMYSSGRVEQGAMRFSGAVQRWNGSALLKDEA